MVATKTLDDLAAEALLAQRAMDAVKAQAAKEQERNSDIRQRDHMVKDAHEFAVEVLGDIAEPLVWTATSTLIAQANLDGRPLEAWARANSSESGPIDLSLWLRLPCPVGHSAQELAGIGEREYRHRIDLSHV